MAKRYFTDESLATFIEEIKSYTDDAVEPKADASDLNSHVNNDDIHFTASEREKLDGIESGANKYTHPNSGVNAGTYKSVTVNALGHVTGGSNPTTLSGYGITDAEAKGTASSTVSTHNTSTSAHSDIRNLITALTTKVNNFLDVDDTTADQLSEVLALIEENQGTIESITSNKVNVSDIVNNLTTNSSNKPLSAAQGVELKSLIDALQAEVDGIEVGADVDLSCYNLKTYTSWNQIGVSDSTTLTSWAGVIPANSMFTISVNASAYGTLYTNGIIPINKAGTLTVVNVGRGYARYTTDGGTTIFGGSNNMTTQTITWGASARADSVNITERNAASAQKYLVPFHSNEYGYKGIYSNNALWFTTSEGSETTAGKAVFSIGNEIAEGTAGNKQGRLRIYSNSTYYTDIYTNGELANNRNIYLPKANGTLALTSELASYLPLSGGTLTGSLNANGGIDINSKVILWSDDEGGNISVLSPNGVRWDFDAYDDNLRIFTHDTTSGNYEFFSFDRNSGSFVSTTGGVFLNANNYASYALPLTGGELTGNVRITTKDSSAFSVKDNKHELHLVVSNGTAGLFSYTDAKWLLQYEKGGTAYFNGAAMATGSSASDYNQIRVREYTGTPNLTQGTNYIYMQEDWTNGYVNVGINGKGAIGVNKADYANKAGAVEVTSEKPTSNATRYLAFTNGSGGQSVKTNDGLYYITKEGTASAEGLSLIALGNSVASGTAGNKRGRLRIFSNTKFYTDLYAATDQGNNRTIYLPNADGTLALDGHTHNYAGSSSAGGAATSANKINTDAGSASIPVYFANGIPVKCTSVNLNAASASKLAKGRTITIGNTAVSGDNGTGDLTFTLDQIGALPLTGGRLTGNTYFGNGKLYADSMYGDSYPQCTIKFGSELILQSTSSADSSAPVSTRAGLLQVRNYNNTAWAPVHASAFNQESSRKYKENIVDMTEETAMQILKYRPVTYDYINKADGTNCMGMIAEEVAEINEYPVSFVNGEAEGLDYSKFTPQLIKMAQRHERLIQEKDETINELKDIISSLEERINALESK